MKNYEKLHKLSLRVSVSTHGSNAEKSSLHYLQTTSDDTEMCVCIQWHMQDLTFLFHHKPPMLQPPFVLLMPVSHHIETHMSLPHPNAFFQASLYYEDVGLFRLLRNEGAMKSTKPKVTK